jgi:RimJ/RimL family protein N-acetyltransferase
LTFVPPDFEVPEMLETERFRMRMLTINDLDKDFEAVSSSSAHLQKVWRNDWPVGLTKEQNLIDLGWHQKEFQRRSSFAYTVVEPDESRVLGCVYIYPSRKGGFDAEVYFWARESELGSGLETELGARLREWFENDWPFNRVGFPGKDIPWDEWDNLPERAG